MNLENAHALIVGVGADLPVTVNDARALAAVLKDPEKGAYKPENVVLLTEEEANKNNVLQQLTELSEKLEESDDATVVVYYSGHGGQFQTDNNEPAYYLLSHGYDVSDREGTMIIGSEFSNLINNLNAKRLFVMLDCCHASGIISKQVEVTKKSPVKDIVYSNIPLIKTLKLGEGRVFLASCDDDEQSYVFNENYSLFTEVVLEALAGQATHGGDSVKMIHVLYHVFNEVPKRAQVHERVQTPRISSAQNLSADYIICKTSPSSSQIEEEVNQSIPPLIDAHSITRSHTRINLATINVAQPESSENCDEEIREINSYLIHGKTHDALSQCVALSHSCLNDIRSIIETTTANYNSLVTNKIENIISENLYRTELAKINKAIMQMLRPYQ